MTKLDETIFEQALLRLEQGESIQAIAADYHNSTELVEVLETAQLLQSIPKRMPPTPLKQRRYAQKQVTASPLFNLLNAFKYAAIPLVLVIAFAGSQSLIHATEASLPGDPLFSLKRATEKARISLTFDDQQAAYLKLEITQKRLEETKQVLTTNSDPQKQALALAELKQQTEKTFESVAPVATAAAVTKNDNSLINTLVSLNKEQKSLLEKPRAEETTQTLATITQENDKTIAKLIATVNEQTLADLPNKISVVGQISNRTNKSITVEQNTFMINDATTITDINGEAMTPDKLGGKISIVGTRADNTLLAKKIILLEKSEQPETKPAITTTTPPAVKGSVTKTPPTPTSSEPVPTEPEQPDTTETPIEPNQARAGFILEPAQKQYNP